MNAVRLLAHYEKIADAPDAIARLRRFILDLAVRGKLVPQDPNDEPASELLKRFAAEKAQLVKAGKIRKPKALAPINSDDIPAYEEIVGWTWVRLGEASSLITKGSTPTSYGHAYTDAGVNFVKVESIRNGVLRPENITSFISEETNQFLARSRLTCGDILFSIAGSIGTCAVVTEECLPANTNQALAIIRGTQPVFIKEFLLKSLQSSVATSILGKARGGAMNNVSLEDIQSFVIPLPPIAEQRRIVIKVDELMALCDQLEKSRAAREETRDRLTAASLARLDDPAPETFQTDAHFALDVLPSITTCPEHIGRLRQTILNLAIRGKIVQQDPNDRPALELLNQIAAEKQSAGERANPRSPQLPLFDAQDDPPFELPSSWLWIPATYPARQISDVGKKIKTSDVLPKGSFPVVDQGKMFIRGYSNDESKVVHIASPIIVFGDHTRETKLIDFDFVVGADGVKLLQPLGLLPKYYFMALQWLPLDSRGYGRHFKLLKASCIPLAPLAEQHRIVAKVDELMTLCDQIEACVTAGVTARSKLLDALLHEALEPAVAQIDVAT